MSNLLEQASLVMIPSGYAEDIVYSEIPLDGSGDLQLTRASNGTRVNSAGLVEVCPWNLLQNSENFTSNWNPNNNTITANTTTAPNGTTTADTFTLIPSGDSSVYQAVNGESNNYTTSVYAKYVSGDKYLYFFSQLNSQGAKVWFDIQNGTVSNQLSGFTGTIENVGNGWYKCSMYNTTASISDYIQFGISTTNSSRTLSNNSVAYFWGAQVNVGTAKPYFPTTDRLNVPRLTYQNGGGGCPSLLLEKQSTNLVSYSEDFTNSYWGLLNSTITPNNTISPDGTQNADKFVENNGTGEKWIYSTPIVTAGSVYTYSIFAKKGERDFIYINAYSNANLRAWFNLNTGTIGATDAGVSAKIENYGNGWYKCSVTITAAIGVQFYLLGVSNANNVVDYSGNGTSGIYIWGAQGEQSSYPTSYIPTTSASATRVADACFKTGISSLIGQTEGVIFVQGSRFALDSVKSALFAALEKTSTGATMRIQYSQSLNILYADVFDGTSFSAQLSGPFIAAGQTFKAALAYKNNDFAFAVNGSIVATDTSGSVPATDDLKINTSQYNNLDAGLQESQLVLFKTRLSNSELQSLTTL